MRICTRMPLILTTLILSFLLSGCFVSDKQASTTASTSSELPVTISSPSVVIPLGSITANEYDSFSYLYGFSTATVTTGFSISNKPNWASFNTATGEITGSAEYGLYSSVVITRHSLSGDLNSGSLSIFIYGDPLTRYSWHLINTAQSTFSSSNGISGYDLNMSTALINKAHGNGVKVLISDTGIDYVHEDLKNNISLTELINYNDSGYPMDENGHGTSVAGIIGAQSYNNIGGRGVASEATLIANNFLDSFQDSATTLDQANGSFDIFNYSYGDYYPHDQITDPDYVDQLKYGVENLRSGNGAIYIKSAGNEFNIGTYDFGNFISASDACVNGVPSIENFYFSHNANLPLDNEQAYLIIVGAIDADGVKSPYSSAGSNLLVVAPGGAQDYGDTAPAIISTDISSCAEGFALALANPINYINSFEYGHALNTVCNYTSTMNGTSASVPMVSGAAALILEENPNLSWRDVKHILIKTAVQVDAGIGVTNHPSNHFKGHTCFDLAGHTYEEGWLTNGATNDFHNWYGFGLVDIDAAISMANGYSVNLGTYQSESTISAPNSSIPDNSSTGVSDTINLTSSLIIESVSIKINVTHNSTGDIGIELTSPSGMKSILLNINNSMLMGSDSNLTNLTLLSNAFYGESATGNWTLKVIDGYNNNSGTFKNWEITINGH
jgi:subtilisin-like proprotein convertase family protein/subtilisin family serine protease